MKLIIRIENSDKLSYHKWEFHDRQTVYTKLPKLAVWFHEALIEPLAAIDFQKLFKATPQKNPFHAALCPWKRFKSWFGARSRAARRRTDSYHSRQDTLPASVASIRSFPFY